MYVARAASARATWATASSWRPTSAANAEGAPGRRQGIWEACTAQPHGLASIRDTVKVRMSEIAMARGGVDVNVPP